MGEGLVLDEILWKQKNGIVPEFSGEGL